MAKTTISTKHLLIDKANTTVVIATSVAAFVLVFSLVASKSLINQAAYQNRVISKDRQAVNQLKTDIATSATLVSSYKAFTSTSQNVLNGNPQGSGVQDGNNAKIILDALPSSYDFPALTNSLEVLLGNAGVQINSITGTDEEITQGSNKGSSSPQPVAMPFQISVSGNYTSVQNLINEFERSIRPFQIQSLQISGSQNQLTMNVMAQTFYQPAKTLNITTELVK